MEERPLFYHDIEKLEQVVEENKGIKPFLEIVLNEIEHRNQKKRVITLKSKIEKLIILCDTNSLEVNLIGDWISHKDLDRQIPININIFPTVIIRIPPSSCIMVCAAIKLLSLLNLLSCKSSYMAIEFEGKNNASIGYLQRMNFFQNLQPTVKVLSESINIDKPSAYYGKNNSLVEIEKVSSISHDENLPTRLCKTILNHNIVDKNLEDGIKNTLQTAIENMFDELTDNIVNHSESNLTGFATCQIYKPKGDPVAHISVCDSGKGILNTLRPTLSQNYPEHVNLNDDELILEMFKHGVSRHGDDDGGSGLPSCAKQALKFNASVHIRTNKSYIELIPDGKNTHKIKRSNKVTDLLYLEGTQITFEFPLYKSLNN